jgi:hypothetical protein
LGSAPEGEFVSSVRDPSKRDAGPWGKLVLLAERGDMCHDSEGTKLPEGQRSVRKLVEVEPVAVRCPLDLGDDVPAPTVTVGDGEHLTPGNSRPGLKDELDGVRPDGVRSDGVVDPIGGAQLEGAALRLPSVGRGNPGMSQKTR